MVNSLKTVEVEVNDNSERDSFIQDCLNDILNDISKTYQNKTEDKNVNLITNRKLPKSKDLVTIKDIIELNQINTMRTIPFTQIKSQNIYNLYHLHTHQQFVSNTCGYHATFNILEVLEALKVQDLNKELRILSSSEFWSYKNNITNFIWQHKLRKEPNNNKRPWRETDVLHGEFERSYLNLCLKKNDRFKQALQSDSNFKVLYYSWEYQFGRVIQGEIQQRELQSMMNEFIQFKEKDKHIVFTMMLGITNHWCSFIAHKYNDIIEFYFFDSRNRDYLQWDDEQIQQWLLEAKEKREKMGQKPYSDFEVLVQTTCIHDIQESLEIICECLIGNMTLHDYQCNNLFLVFEKQFKKKISYVDVLSSNDLEIQIANSIVYARDYYYTIQSFLKTPNILKFLKPSNQEKYLQMKQVFTIIFQQNRILNPKTYHESHIESLYVLLDRAKI